MIYKLSAKKTSFGERLRKCADNDCTNAVPNYNCLCLDCRRKHKVKSEKHMVWMIDKDVALNVFNKHIAHLKSRSQYIS